MIRSLGGPRPDTGSSRTSECAERSVEGRARAARTGAGTGRPTLVTRAVSRADPPGRSGRIASPWKGCHDCSRCQLPLPPPPAPYPGRARPARLLRLGLLDHLPRPGPDLEDQPAVLPRLPGARLRPAAAVAAPRQVRRRRAAALLVGRPAAAGRHRPAPLGRLLLLHLVRRRL